MSFFFGVELVDLTLLVALPRMEFASEAKAILLARVAVPMLISARKCISDSSLVTFMILKIKSKKPFLPSVIN